MNISYNYIKNLKYIFGWKIRLLFSVAISLSFNLYSINSINFAVRNDLTENILNYSNHILVEFNSDKKDYDFFIRFLDSLAEFFISNAYITKYISEDLQNFKKNLYSEILNKDIQTKELSQELIENFFKELESFYDKHDNALKNSHSNFKKFTSKYKLLITLALGIFSSGIYFKFGKKNKSVPDNLLDYDSSANLELDNDIPCDKYKLDSNLYLDKTLADNSIPIDNLVSDDNLSDFIQCSSDSDISTDSESSDEHFSSQGRRLIPSQFAKDLYNNKSGSRKTDRRNLKRTYGRRSLKTA